MMNHRLRALSEMEMAEQTQRTVNLLDVAGHVKYLKTTLHGILGQRPDYIMVCVSAVHGLTRISIEHISLAVYLNVPLVLLLTKTDLVLSDYLKQLTPQQRQAVAPQLRSPTQRIKQIPVLKKVFSHLQEQLQVTGGALTVMTSQLDLMQYVSQLHTNNNHSLGSGSASGKHVVPLVLLSSVANEGVSLVRALLFQLPTPKKALKLPPLPLANPPFTPHQVLQHQQQQQHQQQEEAGVAVVLNESQRRFNFIRILGAFSVTDQHLLQDNTLELIANVHGGNNGTNEDGELGEDAEGDGLDWGDEPIVASSSLGIAEDNSRTSTGNGNSKFHFDASRYGTDSGDWDKALRKKQQQAQLPPPSPSTAPASTSPFFNSSSNNNSTSNLVSGGKHSSYSQFLQTEKGQLHLHQQKHHQKLLNLQRVSMSPPSAVESDASSDDLQLTPSSSRIPGQQEEAEEEIQQAEASDEAVGDMNDSAGLGITSEALLDYERFLMDLSAFVSDQTQSQHVLGSSNCNSPAPPLSSGSNPSSSFTSSLRQKKILIGKVLQGRLSAHDVLLLGPNSVGRFDAVQVSSVRLNNVPVKFAKVGQTATFQLTRLSDAEYVRLMSEQDTSAAAAASTVAAETSNALVKPATTPSASALATGDTAVATAQTLAASGTGGIASMWRRRSEAGGLVLLPLHTAPMAVWEFSAELSLLPGSTVSSDNSSAGKRKMKLGYEAVVHIGAIRQTVKVIHISSRSLSEGRNQPKQAMDESHGVPHAPLSIHTSARNEQTHTHGQGLSLQMWREVSSGSDVSVSSHIANDMSKAPSANPTTSSTSIALTEGVSDRHAVFVVTDSTPTPRRVLPGLLHGGAKAQTVATGIAALSFDAADNDDAEDTAGVNDNQRSIVSDSQSADIEEVNGANKTCSSRNMDSIEQGEMYEGDRAIVRFRFVFNPEFVSVGEAMILREDRIRALGTIVQTSPVLIR